MSTLKIDIPDNIDKLSEVEITKFCDKFGDILPPSKSVDYVKLIYQILGYDLTNDLLYAIVDEPKAQFILSQAGGGKTTNASVKINKNKLLRKVRGENIKGENMLVLVYNHDNVKDFIDRNDYIASSINKYLDRYINPSLEKPLNIDYKLNVMTIHSFCHTWVMKEYKNFLGTSGYRVLDKELQENILNTALAKIYKKIGSDVPKKFDVESFTRMYNYVIETDRDIDYYKDSEIVQEVGLPLDVLKKLNEDYTMYKRLFKVFDFTDLLVLYKKLYETNEEFRTRISGYYDYIVADEIQDLTPMMNWLLKTLMSKDNQILCIGDDDQSIYRFRGSDRSNALSFRDNFEGAKITMLQVNRRCPKNVLSMAKAVIEMLPDRYPKEIKGIKPDGDIYFTPYNNRGSQYTSLVNEIINKEYTNYEEIVISGRENITSLGVSVELEKRGIPYKCGKGSNPYSYLFTKSIIDVLEMLIYNSDRKQFLNLYKVLPMSKDEVYVMLDYDKSKKKFKNNDSDFISFHDIKFPQDKMNNVKFKSHYKFIENIVLNPNMKLEEYFNELIYMIRSNYWNSVEYMRKTPKEIIDVHNSFIAWFFEPKTTAKNRIKVYYEKLREINYNLSNNLGVTLCAFHSLKGLEFDHVFLCDLNESIFPNFAGIDLKPYDDKTKSELKGEEIRLMYVAITRAKKSIHFYYSSSDKSIFIPIIMSENKEEIQLSESHISFNSTFSDQSEVKVQIDSNEEIKQSKESKKEETPSIKDIRARRLMNLTRNKNE